MTSKFYFTLLLLLFTCGASLYSQSNMRKGYIILMSGDTLHGFIKYDTNNQLLKSCKFSNALKGKTTEYSSSQLRAFRYEQDKMMVSKKRLETNESVFYEEIVKGPASLYKMEEEYFLLKSDTAFLALKNEVKELNNNVGSYEKKTNEYLKVLGYYMSECPEIRKYFSSTQLSEKSLSRIFIKYNECMGTATQHYKSEKASLKIELAPYIGYFISFFNNDEDPYFHYYLESSPNYKGVLGGLKLYISSPRINEKFALITGMGYLSFLTKNTNSVHVDDQLFTRNRSEDSEFDISIHMVDIPLGLQYRFRGRKSSFYAGIGISTMFILNQSYESTHIWNYDSDEYYEQKIWDPNPLTFRTYQQALWLESQYMFNLKRDFTPFISINAKIGQLLIKDLDKFTYQSQYLGLSMSVGIIL